MSGGTWSRLANNARKPELSLKGPIDGRRGCDNLTTRHGLKFQTRSTTTTTTMATLRKSRRLETKETTAIYADAASDEESPEGQAGSSKKRSTRATTPSDHASEVPSEDELDDAPASSGTKRKRAGKSSRKVSKAGSDQRPVKRHRGNRGLLERMTEMPMDLLFEVSGILCARESKVRFTLLFRYSASLTPWISCTCLGRPKRFVPF